MITDFDDFMIHQTFNPVDQPGPSDRNFYDRYWFDGFDQDGEFIFEIGFGLYPNRHVMDAHFSVSIGGRQHSFHASRRAPRERSDSTVGPLRLEVVQPMRIVRVCVEPNETGIECDLTFRAATIPAEEPKNLMFEGTRVIMHNSRFTQLGRWQGYFSVDGARTEVSPQRVIGMRDKSWGVRPVGEPEAGAPGLLNQEPGVYWVWAPIHFGDFCTHFNTFEDHDGNPTQLGAAIVPVYESLDEIPRGEDPGRREMASGSHRIKWTPGTRLPASAEIELVSQEGEKHLISLEPMIRFQMLGIGYQHPEWGHAFWKGEEAIGSESWKLDDLDLLDYKHIHAHQVCRARMGDRIGVGTLETVVFGRHDPSGFKSILDGAP
ncbi:MAG: hypothetical protein JRS35_24850 [Deltaproteobacteria bacterium]|nr:hypothetical protein [Deltaproteobacteria bacterium]